MAISADLPSELEKRIEEEMESGRYKSKSEFLRDAIRLKLIESDLELRVISDDTRETLMERLKGIEDSEKYTSEELREEIE
jgi:putative addiction module CopG family antidote